MSDQRSPAALCSFACLGNPLPLSCSVLHCQSLLTSCQARHFASNQSQPTHVRSLACPVQLLQRTCTVLSVVPVHERKLQQSCHPTKVCLADPTRPITTLQQASFLPPAVNFLTRSLRVSGCQSRSSSATCPKHPRTTQQEFATNLCRVHLNSSS